MQNIEIAQAVAKSKAELRARLEKLFIVSDLLRHTIHETWGQIGADVERSADGPGNNELTNALAIECCIDMDNLTNFGQRDGKAVDAELSTAIQQFGYERVLRNLSEQIRLV